jgi:beta-glucosidase
VHGHNNVPGAVIFPHNIGLGASRDPDLVERVGRATAEEVAGTDIDWTFSPVLASARDERWGRTYESFGETPELAELLGPALIRGLQGERLGRGPNSVLACAKHFLGDGSTAGGHNAGDDPLTLDQVREQLLPAYQQAISAGVGSIMVSYSSIEGVKMHCHGPLLNDILKGELGFGGLLVSDWQAIEQLPGDYATQLASSINAGVDMVMNPRRYTGFLTATAALVPDRIPEARIDDAVTRILTVKCELGMLQPGKFAPDSKGSVPTSPELANIGSAAHREIAREAVRKSLVLLKNKGAVLPLSKTIARVHLAGSHADDLGEQTGGWTISWQGQSGTWTQGTTIRQAFEAALGADHVTYSRDGSGAAGADAAVLVIGEEPYAEGLGDSANLALDPSALAAAQAIHAAHVPLIVVLISGRPMLIGDLLGLSDAFVAAWLPGTEGNGVSDVVLGDFDFTGKLPHSWPRSIDQVPINIGDANYDPLFEYGFGLSYADAAANPG